MDLKDLMDRADLMDHATRVSQSFKVLKYDYKYIILINIIQMKTCINCNKSKAEDEYRGQNVKKCRQCNREMVKKWAEKNREKKRAAQRRYQAKNPNYLKQWRKKNPEKARLQTQKRNAKPTIRIQNRLKIRFKNWLFKGVQSARTERLVGCTKEKVWDWIEAQFLPGMTWKNYGAWQIDHMLPWEEFNLLDEGTHPKVMHYTNLQPLWAPDNNAKHSKVIYDMEWRNTWYIHTGTEYTCRKIQVENKIQIKIKHIVGFSQGFAHAFVTN